MTAFLVAAFVPLFLALNGGGYDLVIRQEVGLGIWALLALGFAFDVFPRGRPPAAALFALASLGALVALNALALAWTESAERTFAELARVIGYSGLVVLAYASLNRHTWRAAAGGVAAAALLLPLLAIASRLAPGTFEDATRELFDIDRLSYPLEYWNALSCAAAVAVAIGLTWSAHGRGLAERALTLGSVPPAALAAYLTYSRAGVVAIAVGIVAALALSRNRPTLALHGLAALAASAVPILVARGQPDIADGTGSEGAGLVLLALVGASAVCAVAAALAQKLRTDDVGVSSRAGWAIAGIAVVAVAIVASASADRISNGWDEFTNDDLVTESGEARLTTAGGNRYDVWGAAVDAFESDPWRGIGPGSFEFFWSRNGDDAEFVRDAHSLYLELLAELGVFGLLALLAAIGWMLAAALLARRRLLRRADHGAASALLAGLVVFLVYAAVDWVWEVPALVAVALGSVAIVGCALSPRWGSRRFPLPLRLAAVGACLIAAAVQLPLLSSTERLRASADAYEDGDLGRAQMLADEAIDAASWSAGPYAQRALVAERQGRLADAQRDLGEAISNEPTNWRHHVLLARIYARRGDREGARKALSEARALAPNSTFLMAGSPFQLEIEELLGPD